jgi:hypothetical protein
MKAMILAYETSADFEKRRNKSQYEAYMGEWRSYGDSLIKAGVFIGGAALEGPETATTLSVRGGRRTVEDGPFADSKEQLGGYFLIEARSLDHAAKLAQGCPAARSGRVEVRLIPDFGQGA